MQHFAKVIKNYRIVAKLSENLVNRKMTGIRQRIDLIRYLHWLNLLSFINLILDFYLNYDYSNCMYTLALLYYLVYDSFTGTPLAGKNQR